MKRLNKTQKEIEELAKRVPALTDAQKEWAVRRERYFRAVAKGTESVVCTDCKGIVPIATKHWDGKDKVVRCPHCGAKVQVRIVEDGWLRKRYNGQRHQEGFFEIMNVVGGWQVTRLIYMERYTYVRRENTPWEFHEVCQAWNHPSQKTTFFRALPKKIMGSFQFNPYALRTWRYEENPDEETFHHYVECENVLEARMAGGNNYFSTDSICPKPQILQYYKTRGLGREVFSKLAHNAMWLFESISAGNYRPMYETMLKGGDYEVFNRVTEHRGRDNADAYFAALRICKRNGFDYKKDATEWLDMVRLLIDLGYDYHSPHYVCPAEGVHAMHQRLLNAKRRMDEEEELKRRMARNADYRKRIARYLDMDIHGSGLHLVVLPDIKAFKDEGDHLHHCVYRCEYFNKEDSLILSARDEQGKRWETIEVSLKSFEILQSYGYGDKYTEKHKQIATLVNDNMWQIRQRAKARPSAN